MKFLLDKYIAGLCFYRTAFPVQKSGLKSSAFRSKSFPQISSESYRHNAVSNRFSSHLSTSPTNAATFVSRGCGGYTLGFAQRIAHNGTHGETGGVSDGGAITTLRAFLRGSETLRGRVSERRTLPLLGLGREVLSKNAESLRDSDALMRVAVPRRRGPAGLRDPIAVSLTALMGFAVLLSRFVGTQKIERLFFSYSGAFLEQKA